MATKRIPAWEQPFLARRQERAQAKPATTPAHAAAPSTFGAGGVSYGGMWPDGTIKLLGPDGKVLPQGTKVDVSGNQVHITGPDGSPDGSPVQLTGAGGRVYNPVQGLGDLPAGSYDPSIDYQSGAANRGVGYAQQDYGTNYGMVGPDGKPLTGADGTTPLSLTDLLNGGAPSDVNAQNPDGTYKYGRGIRDYFQNVGRENENYNTATGNLNTSYQRLGQTQLQGINAAGDLGGGALAQSLSKRTANQTHDQSGLDTTHGRTLTDLLTGTTRGATDAYTTLSRTVGENAPYQAALLTTAGQEAGGSLAGNPNYETHNGTIYQRQPAGGVTPVAKTTPAPKPKRTPYPHRIGKSFI